MLQYTNVSVWHKYSSSLFRALSHMLSIGYGPYPPKTTMDMWMVIASMFLGASFYALFIANISSIILTMDASGRQYEEKVRVCDRFTGAICQKCLN